MSKLFKMLLALMFFVAFAPPVRAQVTLAAANALVIWPLVDFQEGRNSPGPVRPVGWCDPFVMWENTQGQIFKAVRPDTTRLDSLTKKYDWSWTINVTTKTRSGGYDLVKFAITEQGRRSRNSTKDTTIAIPLKGSGWYCADVRPGLDLWFSCADSLNSGDVSRIYFYHTNFVQHTGSGVLKVTTQW